MNLRAALRSMRPRQWIKNGVVLAGVIYSRNLFDPPLLFRALGAVLIFCGIAGAGYLINDWFDRERDRAHPEKASRPLAAGTLTARAARVSAGVILALCLAAAFALEPRFGLLAGAYALLIFLYSAGLKRVPGLDVLVIAFGFVLRAAAGVAVVRVELSGWLVVCTFLAALFLVLGKRYADPVPRFPAGAVRGLFIFLHMQLTPVTPRYSV